MKRIAIDMDEVIADAMSKYLRLYNEGFQEQLTAADLHGVKLRALRPERSDDIHEIFMTNDFFRDLEVMPHSQEVIRELSESYEIFITTAAMEVPTSFNAKYAWLKEHFPFLSDMNFVFCGDKSIIRADYLIDDNAKHFERFEGQGLLFTSPHNILETGYVRVNNWLEVRDFFAKALNM
ncbi:5'-3'-deoxyribonucleotidase [Paenibacillus validus]|uniref:5'-3'-deoxyribonucleotidase n=1 Tax=Paenibacillus validus TaxID=44253 RepID=A0A7X2Z8Y2_9BACL|nr:MULTISPECIES: 5'-3'-deoxyribonucleotidase [Paenibacillus]MED4599561.1 5'-3'-deoxyribonucleotidase [Paenibacillus validus]MED4607095.1 5'-3'-deoxyribonucleotidase [Paenibacillus validus]MUG70544.1 5'-3'-deoxyribonucleotidase [Paenibacillus validus]